MPSRTRSRFDILPCRQALAHFPWPMRQLARLPEHIVTFTLEAVNVWVDECALGSAHAGRRGVGRQPSRVHIGVAPKGRTESPRGARDTPTAASKFGGSPSDVESKPGRL